MNPPQSATQAEVAQLRFRVAELERRLSIAFMIIALVAISAVTANVVNFAQ